VLNAESHPLEKHNDTAGAAMARQNAPAGQLAPGQTAAGAAAANGAAPVVGAPGGPAPFRPITADQLRAAMPKVPADKVDGYVTLLNYVMEERQINTPGRQAAFLGQLAHESGQLRSMTERDSGTKYEGRKDLGNTEKGDGEKFRGRGPIQLTGRANYESAARALGVDLVNHPELVAQEPSVGFAVAAWFWSSRSLNRFADGGDYREISRRVVGTYDDPSTASRDTFHTKAKKALGVP
jgi:putative chitinase